MKPTKTKSHGSKQTARFLGFIISLVALTSVAVASPGSGDRPITDTLSLDRCLELARANSPELNIATGAIEASRFDRKLVRQTRWPQLRLSAGAGYAPFTHDFGYDPAVSNGGELGARIVAEQTLYSGGLTGLQLKQADTRISRRTLAWQQQDRDVVYAVRLAFIDLLAAERQRDLNNGSVEELADYAGLVADLNQSGRAKYSDVLSARVELARAQIDSGAAVQAVSTARLNLNRIIGLPDHTLLDPAGSLESLLIAAADTVPAIPDTMTADNLDVAAARLDLKQSRVELDLSRTQWKPTVSLTADAGVMTSRENLIAPPSERYNSAGYSVGISIDMPLWDRGKRRTETARSRVELKSAEDKIALVKRNVTADYRDTRLRLVDTRRRLLAIRETLQTAEKNYLLTSAQYADGNATAAEVLLAQQSLTDTRRSEIDALAKIQSLKARLDLISRPEQEGRP